MTYQVKVLDTRSDNFSSTSNTNSGRKEQTHIVPTYAFVPWNTLTGLKNYQIHRNNKEKQNKEKPCTLHENFMQNL